MKSFQKIQWLLLVVLGLAVCAAAQAQTAMKVVATYPLTGDGHFDYLASANNGKLYVSHGNQVNVMEEKTGKQLGVISGLLGVHGIAFDYNVHRGFISNGKGNNVSVFDLSTDQVLTTIPTGNNPDGIIYEPYTKTIITANGKSESLSIIDPRLDKVIHTVALSGKPEAMASDDKGHLFVNIEDKSLIQEVDLASFKVVKSFDLAPAGQEPSGLAIDLENKLLFAGCANKVLVVLNYENGRIVSKYPIGEDCDAVAYDPSRSIVFSSNGDGTLTVLKRQKEGKFVLGNVVTQPGAKTMALNPMTHTVYLSTADFTLSKTDGKKVWVPNSFKVLVVR